MSDSTPSVLLHLATSADGFIARPSGDSSWVSQVDEGVFVERVQDAGCVIIGKRTFDQYHGIIYPVPKALNIVLTENKEFKFDDGNVAVAHSPEEALSLAKEKGFLRVVIAGGARTAAAFFKKGLIDEIFLSVHPIVLDSGLKALDDLSSDPRYKLEGERELPEGVTELHYRMI